MKKINNFFFITSFCIHLILLLLIFFINPRKNYINKDFLILGMHSQIPTQAIFKSTKNIRQTNWLAKRKAIEKTAHEKLLALKKQSKNKTNKPNPQIKKAPSKKTTIIKKIKKELPRKIANNMKTKETKKDGNKSDSSKKTKSIKKLKELNMNLLDETDPIRIACRNDIRLKIAKYWKPPIGIPKGTELLVEVIVNKKGIIEDYKIKQKSTALLLDLSVLKTLGILKNKKETLKKYVHGKKFPLRFML